MRLLKRIELKGYKSFKETVLDLTPLNVLIGSNGSGKSNLVSFFRLLNHMMTGDLQGFIGRCGGANSLLHYGAKVTPQLEATLDFESPDALNSYHMRLGHAAGDTLVFLDERIIYAKREFGGPPFEMVLGVGHKETELRRQSVGDAALGQNVEKSLGVFRSILSGCRVFQFHDTSETAHIRLNGDLQQNRFLMSDGGNLAAMLYRMQKNQADCYERIVGTIRQIAPFFDDFQLSPSELDPTRIQLRWSERKKLYDFGPHLLSDGTLRAMAMVTLLLQPEKDLPSVLVIDEPELGLHPYAITVIAGLLRSASKHAQVIVGTQSETFLDHFEPEEVVVTERCEGESIFRRLATDELQDWLEDYRLSDLWEKNVIGGRPSR